jgi:hypothetical protein
MRHRRTLFALWLATMALAGPASALPQTFDLQCGETRYRIDVRKKQWCEGACEERRWLFGATRETVILTLYDHFSLTYDIRSRTMADGTDLLGTRTRDVTQCRMLKFSGFPLESPGAQLHP